MNVLGMGPMELLLIIVLALIVFGPAKLPEIMGQVGKAIADFRRATSELSDEFNRTIQTELNETRQVVEETKAVLTEARNSVTDVQLDVKAAVTGVPAPARVASSADVTQTVNGSLTEPHVDTNGLSSPGAPVTPPLADTSQWSWEAKADSSSALAPGESASLEGAHSEAAAERNVTAEHDGADRSDEFADTPSNTRKTSPPGARDDLAPPY